MARLVLHIGTHNTGGTALQDRFAAHAGLLAQHGLIYPRPGRATGDHGPGHHGPGHHGPGHHGSGHDGLAAPWNPGMKPHEPPEGAAAALRRIVQDHGDSDATVFLSSAEFSRARQGGGHGGEHGGEQPGGRVDFRALRALVAGFRTVEVVCVLRDQWQFAQSAYLEMSRRQNPGTAARTPDQLLDSTLRHHMIRGLWTDYDRLYRHLSTAFAPQEITLLDHQACTAHAGGLAGAMLEHLGLKGVALEAPTPAGAGIAGQGSAEPPPLAVLAASRVAAPYPAPRWMVEATRGAFAAQYGRERDGIIWTRDQLATLRAYGDAANARLSASRPGFALTPATPAPDTLYPEDLHGDFWRRSNRWLFAGTQGRSWG